VPAPPPRISLRGRVLPRLQAPRHPPSAHTCRASLAPPNAPPSPTRAHPCHQVRWPAPGHVTHVHLVLFASRHGLCLCVCNTVRLVYDPTAPACMPARIGGSGPLKVRAPSGLSKCGEDVERTRTSRRGLPPVRRWSRGDSNPGPPPCKGGALPAKLRPLVSSVGAPVRRLRQMLPRVRWARLDSNQGPRPYQGRALTS
jgi:hypothetical protein